MKKIIYSEWFWILIITIVTFFSYYKIVHFDFVYWDDDKQIFNNIYVTQLSLEHIVHNFLNERFTFIPLTLYSILYNIVGKDPYFFHLVSIIIHLLNILMFYIVLKKFSFSTFINFFSVIIFALHPLRIESVAWISEWKDLLFTFFSLCGIWFYLKWNEQKKITQILLYSLMFVLASFSKIQGLILPFSVILLDLFIHRRINFIFFIFNLSMFSYVLFFYPYELRHFLVIISGLIIGYIFKRKFQKNLFIPNDKKRFTLVGSLIASLVFFLWFLFTQELSFWEGNLNFSFIDRIFFSGYSLYFYVKQFFLPISQVAIHPYPNIHNVTLWLKWWPYLISWIVLFLIIFLLYRKKLYTELFGIMFFILNISIVLHFISIEGRLIVAERYTYFAYTGLIVSSSHLLNRIFNKYISIKIVFLFILTSILSVLIFVRTDIWKNTETLFYSVLLKKPQTTFAWLNLGSYYLEQKQFNNAIKCYNAALKTDTSNAQLYLNRALAYTANGNIFLAEIDLNKAYSISNNIEEKSLILVTLGQLAAENGNLENAINYYHEAIKVYPNNYKAYLQKAMLFTSFNSIFNLDSALFYAKKAVEINKYYSDAYHTISWLYLNKQDINKAKMYAKISIKTNPLNALANNTLGYIYQITNNLDSAFIYYQKAIKIDTTIPELYRNRAWIYYQTSQFSKAIDDYNYVINKKPNDIISLINRAYCYMQQKQYHLAIVDFKKVMALQPDSADNYYNVAWAYMQAKQTDSSFNYLNLTLVKNPNHIKALFDRGILYFNKKNYQQALNDLYKLQLLLPENGEIFFWIGKIYYAMNMLNKACENFKLSNQKGFFKAKEYFSICE